jgi:hypothetical protein
MSQKVELIIDTREKYLIKELEKEKIKFTISQLELGDIIFKKDEEIIFIIERTRAKVEIIRFRNFKRKDNVYYRRKFRFTYRYKNFWSSSVYFIR